MMLKRVLFFGLMTVLSMAAEAQDVQAPEDMICTTHRDLWLGSNEETKNITSTPVPESFRQIIETSGCRNTNPSDLIDWHRKYGSENTMRAALDYLEDSVKNRGVGMISRGENFKPTPKHKSGDYAVIARYYLMGAHAFSSLDFVKNAESYEIKTKKICNKLLPDWVDPTWESGCRMDGDATVIEKLSRRIAVARTLISREKSDVEKAKSILARAEMPYRDEFVENAYESFDGLCKSREKKDACAESYSDEDVRALLTLQTLLATVDNSDSSEPSDRKSYDLYYGLDQMLRVAEAYQPQDFTALNRPDFANQRSILNLAFSDMHFHRALTQVEKKSRHQKNVDPYKIDEDIAEDLFISLDHLLAAEKYTPRYSYPSQWERIAAKFIERMDLVNQLSLEVRYDRWDSSIMDRDRQLEYFKADLNP